MKENLNSSFLTYKLHQKLILVEIKKKILKVSYGLIEDEMYSTENAVDDLTEVIGLIQMEQQGIMSEIEMHKRDRQGEQLKEEFELYYVM